MKEQQFWEDFEEEKVVINCKTEEQAKQLFEMFRERNYMFGIINRIQQNEDTCWGVYKEGTCYCFEGNGVFYGDINEFKEDSYNIVSFHNVFNSKNEPPTLDELKTGMVLVSKDGRISMVLRDTINGDIISGEIWKPLEDVRMYGTREDGSGFDYDIIEVWQPTGNRFFLGDSYCIGETSLNTDNCILVWKYVEQPKRKKMTLEEVEEELGYKIEIIE